MTDRGQPKKSQMAGNMAGVGLIFGILGAALVHGNPGLGGFLILVAMVMLIAAAVAHGLRPRG